MRKIYAYKTKAGTFYIAERGGRFRALLEDEDLGGYTTPQQAADDLAGGHTFTPSSGVDTSRLGVPGDLSRWERLR